jgi:DNA-binding MarR family transcriptional regulator
MVGADRRNVSAQPDAPWDAAATSVVVSAAGRQFTATAMAVLHRYGVPEASWRVLHAISAAPEGLSLIEVARRAHLGASTVTTISDQLAEAGWITRSRDRADRRRVVTVLTPAGRAVIDEARAEVNTALTVILERLSATERDTLTRLLLRLFDQPSTRA